MTDHGCHCTCGGWSGEPRTASLLGGPGSKKADPPPRTHITATHLRVAAAFPRCAGFVRARFFHANICRYSRIISRADAVHWPPARAGLGSAGAVVRSGLGAAEDGRRGAAVSTGCPRGGGREEVGRQPISARAERPLHAAANGGPRPASPRSPDLRRCPSTGGVGASGHLLVPERSGNCGQTKPSAGPGPSSPRAVQPAQSAATAALWWWLGSAWGPSHGRCLPARILRGFPT